MTIQQAQQRLSTFVMRSEKIIGEVVSDWRFRAILSIAVLGFAAAQNWEGLKQTLDVWFTPDKASSRATMMAVIPTVEPQSMFVPKSIDPIPVSKPTKIPDATATLAPTPEKIGTIIFERSAVVTNDTFDKLKMDPRLPFEVGTVSTFQNAQRETNGGSVVVLPQRVYYGAGVNSDKLYCDCYFNRGDILEIEIGIVGVYDGRMVRKIDKSEIGAGLKLAEDTFASLSARPTNLTSNSKSWTDLMWAATVKNGLANGKFLPKDVQLIFSIAK